MLYPATLWLADYDYARGKAYLDNNHPETALPLLQKAATLRPGLDLFESTLGETYASLGQVDNALSAADTNRVLNKYHLNFYKSRAKIYLTLAQTKPEYNQNAAVELAAARTLAPTDPKLAYNLGLVYTRLGDLGSAEKQLLNAIQLKPNYETAYYALTLLYEQDKQLDKLPALLRDAQSHLATYSPTLKEKINQYSSSN